MDVLTYLYSLEMFGMKLGLERMNALMDILDHPEKKFRVVHVTGTNGKGSVCAMLYSILRKSGLRVGLYTSPHLVKFNERIVVGGDEINHKDFIHYTVHIRDRLGDVQPTFFEFTTALAFLYFVEKEVDIAVVEVGMGGRLDATNVVDAEVAVITSIGLEHTEHLGDTVEKIAAEKAGIIKEKSVVVTCVDGAALDVVKEKRSDALVVGDVEGEGEFTFEGKDYFVSLLSKHQVKNACIAIKAAEQLGVSYEDIVEGLRDVYWPGRLDYLYDNMLVDCAHNPDGIRTLVDYVQHLADRKVLLLGIASDKNADEMAQMIAPLFERVIVTEGNFKPLDCAVLGKIVEKYNNNVTVIKDSTIALRAAIDAVSDGKLLLVTGSMYLVGDVMRMVKRV